MTGTVNADYVTQSWTFQGILDATVQSPIRHSKLYAIKKTADQRNLGNCAEWGVLVPQGNALAVGWRHIRLKYEEYEREVNLALSK